MPRFAAPEADGRQAAIFGHTNSTDANTGTDTHAGRSSMASAHAENDTFIFNTQ